VERRPANRRLLLFELSVKWKKKEQHGYPKAAATKARNLRLAVRVDRAAQANGSGAYVRIYDDFNAVFKAAEFDNVASCGSRFERFQAGADGGLLKFAADMFGHPSKFREATDGATGGRGEAGVGIDMQLDAFRFSGHWCPRG
jgi:hypothetical protein